MNLNRNNMDNLIDFDIEKSRLVGIVTVSKEHGLNAVISAAGNLDPGFVWKANGFNP